MRDTKNMEPDQVDIDDLEAFIKGLKHSIDSLDQYDKNLSQGFQAKLAKAISQLRVKKMDKIEPLPDHIGNLSGEDVKKFLLNKLNQLKTMLESGEYLQSRRFKLVMEIAKLREKINSL